MKLKILGVVLFFSVHLFSINNYQPATYPIRVVEGLEYYVYTVEQGEGLYSISRRFGVSQSEINNINPQIHDGLKAGAVILIPKKDEKTPIVQENLQNTDDYIEHLVEKKQTLFAISRKYDVKQEDIVNANPQIANRSIMIGEILKIPVVKLKQKPTTKNVVEPVASNKTAVLASSPKQNTQKNQTEYVVSAGETLYSISRKFNLKVNDLINSNPEVADGLKTGAVLKIPTLEETNSVVSVAAETTSSKNSKQNYRIAYLLPFSSNERNDATVSKFIEFYLGSLLAINNMKNGKINFEILTFDTEKSEAKIAEILRKKEFSNIDLIIGPAYGVQIPIVSDFAKRNKINTMIPFSNSKLSDVKDNPYLFQFNPDSDTFSSFLLNLFKTDFKNANIVFVETDAPKQGENGLDAQMLKSLISSNKIKHSVINRTKFKDWDKYLSVLKKNIVIFDTDDYSSIQSDLELLYEINNQYDVAVIGQYSWRDLRGKKPKMYYVSPFSGSKSGTQFYELQSEKYYGKLLPITNPRFDLLGYDLTTFFLSMIKESGFSFSLSTQSLSYNKSAQSDLNFQRVVKGGGFINQQLYLIEDEATSK
jgi:LysM repeat protein